MEDSIELILFLGNASLRLSLDEQPADQRLQVFSLPLAQFVASLVNQTVVVFFWQLHSRVEVI